MGKTEKKTGIIVSGSKGRMGCAIISAVKESAGLFLAAGVDSGYCAEEIAGAGSKNGDSAGRFLTLKEALPAVPETSGRVVIDFTSRTASLEHVKEAASAGVPIVIGSTGFSAEDVKTITACGDSIPVVLSGNMSLGINVLLNTVYDVSMYLGSAYDCEIIETHHNKKKDAPSGTAKMLAESVAKQRNIPLSESAVYGRHGDACERKKEEIGIFSVRAGDVVGEHKVIFAGNEEVIEITHKAVSRSNFARGAVRAAEWLAGKSGEDKGFHGLYDMRDVMGLCKK